MSNKIKLLSVLIPQILCGSLAIPSIAHAALLAPNIPVRSYRQFANNEGPFKIGAKNVPIYNYQGKKVGVLPLVPNFNAVADAGFMTFIGDGAASDIGHDHSMDST